MSTGGSRKVPLCLQVENFCPNYWLQKKCTIRKNGNTHVQKRGTPFHKSHHTIQRLKI